MAYQFAHVEGYGRAAGKGKKGGHTLASIVAEAERAPGACPHIETPQPPTLLYGVTPAEAAAAATRWAEQAKDARGHAYRKDGLCMLGGVITLPAAMADRWPAFSKDALKWLKKEYGDRLQSVVQHLDEKNPHLHFYAVPRTGERFAELHDGLKAAELADPDRGDRTRSAAIKTAGRAAARLAYAEAMRTWQDRVYTFAKRYGLARIGPKRRRLSRGEWKAENAERERLAARESALEQGNDRLSSRVHAERAELDRKEAAILKMQSDAFATKVEALEIRKITETEGNAITKEVIGLLKDLTQEGRNKAWQAMIDVATAERGNQPRANESARKESHDRGGR